MADIRTFRGARPRTPGVPVGVQMSTFGLDRLEGISGRDLEGLLHDAMLPALEQLRQDWPIDTGASIETSRIETDEVGAKHARVSLKIGGEPLIADPRNVKHIDYAPYIEFNGSPGGTPPGTLLYAVSSQARLIRSLVRIGVADLIERRTRGE